MMNIEIPTHDPYTGELNPYYEDLTGLPNPLSLRSNTIGKKIIGITCSCFDLLHAGHIKMLQEAKNQCDYLIVALQVDPSLDRPEKNKPVQTIVERYIQLKGCKYVDEIVPYQTEEDLEDIFLSFDLDVRIIGEEYKGKEFTAKEICFINGIKIYYNSRQHHFSSTELRERLHTYKKNK
jgi:glycerol-3-phosphate cytidylyltransferase